MEIRFIINRVSNALFVEHNYWFVILLGNIDSRFKPGKSNALNSTLLCGPHYYQELKKIGYDNSKTTLTKGS